MLHRRSSPFFDGPDEVEVEGVEEEDVFGGTEKGVKAGATVGTEEEVVETEGTLAGDREGGPVVCTGVGVVEEMVMRGDVLGESMTMGSASLLSKEKRAAGADW